MGDTMKGKVLQTRPGARRARAQCRPPGASKQRCSGALSVSCRIVLYRVASYIYIYIYIYGGFYFVSFILQPLEQTLKCRVISY